ncbi:MAG: multicopper oxidase domain-containing protein, partial [Vulcanimicrobiaceae bacterium]
MPILPRVRLGTVVSQGPPADVAAAQARALAADRTPTYIHVFTNPQKTKFFINGKVFDENRTDVFVRLGHVEEWTILNKDTQYHDFHIHQTGFLVTDVNGRSTRFDGLRDTFSVPPMVSGKPGEMKAIIPFTNPTMLGRFVFHCHVVKHAQTLPDIGPVPR